MQIYELLRIQQMTNTAYSHIRIIRIGFVD